MSALVRIWLSPGRPVIPLELTTISPPIGSQLLSYNWAYGQPVPASLSRLFHAAT